MNTINVTVSDDLYMQIIMLAAHDGMTPNQFVAAAAAEKVEKTEGGGTGFWPLALSRCAESTPRTLTIFPLPGGDGLLHDHLTPYRQV